MNTTISDGTNIYNQFWLGADWWPPSSSQQFKSTSRPKGVQHTKLQSNLCTIATPWHTGNTRVVLISTATYYAGV